MNEVNNSDEVVFTSAAVLDLLLQIDELKDYTISMVETLDGDIQLQIDDSVYVINNDHSTTIEVEDQVVDEIETTIEDAYADILENEDNSIQPIEAGILKNLVKSLALGGLIRFANKHLLN